MLQNTFKLATLICYNDAIFRTGDFLFHDLMCGHHLENCEVKGHQGMALIDLWKVRKQYVPYTFPATFYNGHHP